MKSKIDFFGIFCLFMVCLFAVGWLLNIYKLFSVGFDELTGILVARLFGIIVAPLGSILGFF